MNRRIARLIVGVAAVCAVRAGVLAAAGEEPRVTPAPATVSRAIVAGGWVDSSGEIRTGGVLVIEGERIASVGSESPAGAEIDRYPAAVACPGLIDCGSSLGVQGGRYEEAHVVDAELQGRDLFNRYSQQLRAALQAGVTTFALAPDDQNLIGGRVAICQTAGGEGGPRVLVAAGPLKLSLSPELLRINREPTSRGGAVGMLRDTIEAARGPRAAAAKGAPPRDEALAAFAAGQLRGLAAAPSGADVLSFVEMSEAYGLKLALFHTHDARQVGERLAGHVSGVIVGPLDLDSSRRDALAAAIFEHYGVPVAIAGGLPDQPADALRVGAAVAARAGLSLPAARRAITAVPAELLGVGDRVGALKAGLQADVVVFSGDPLDLRSRVLAVYVGGRRVYAASEPGTGGGKP